MARILLAEDDTSMREYLQRALQRVGYEVSAVGCGTEAMPLLEAGQYDLLLTDIVMPEMDGIELAQKASAIDPNIRVMFITGFAAVALQGGRTAPEAKLHCASYTPFRGNQTPFNPALIIPRPQIEEDLRQLQPVTDCIRTYAVNQGLDQAVPVAAALGMKVMLGIWIGRNPVDNEAQITTAIALAKAHPETVRAIIVGNEVLLRGEQTGETLAAIAQRIKAESGARVTYADVWEYWLRAPEVLKQSVDFITIHILPYWEDDPLPVSDADRVRLAHVGVNTLISVRSNVRMPLSPRTLTSGGCGVSDWKYLAARRLALFIAASIDLASVAPEYLLAHLWTAARVVASILPVTCVTPQPSSRSCCCNAIVSTRVSPCANAGAVQHTATAQAPSKLYFM